MSQLDNIQLDTSGTPKDTETAVAWFVLRLLIEREKRMNAICFYIASMFTLGLIIGMVIGLTMR